LVKNTIALNTLNIYFESSNDVIIQLSIYYEL